MARHSSVGDLASAPRRKGSRRSLPHTVGKGTFHLSFLFCTESPPHGACLPCGLPDPCQAVAQTPILISVSPCFHFRHASVRVAEGGTRDAKGGEECIRSLGKPDWLSTSYLGQGVKRSYRTEGGFSGRTILWVGPEGRENGFSKQDEA